MDLIRSKIERPWPVPHLTRPRLVSALSSSVESGLATFVVGRAGTGKSVAALDLAASCRGRTAWYTVDESDTDFPRFTRYLSAALGLRQHQVTGDHRAETVADQLLADVFDRADVPRLLVVEDLHLVYDTPWSGPFIARLLPMLPLEVHVLVTTRVLPPVPLWRMRSKQTLSVVTEDALTFTEAEAIAWFARYGLSKSTALTAVRKTRGRAARLDGLARCLAGQTTIADGRELAVSPFKRTG